MQVVLPDGQSPRRVSPRGWSIGKNIRGKRLPVVVLPIAIPQTSSLVVTSRKFLVVMKYTSPLCAKAVIIAQTTSGLIPNWLEYPADSKPHSGIQRLKCSVAETEGHRIVYHNLTPTVMRKEIHIVSNPNRGGWDAKRPNADRASKHFDTKKEAMEWSRNLANKEGLELIPHGTDGKIQNPNSYGNDPYPPKDTRL